MELFEEFPSLEGARLLIKQMQPEDVEALAEITGNPMVYRYIPPLLYKKSKGTLLTAIRNLGGRDFEKKRWLIAGIYLQDENKLVGLAQAFDYKKRAGDVTIGYTINEEYWNRGIATEACEMLVQYLAQLENVRTLWAFVMPENVYSARVLQKNGFADTGETRLEHNWGGRENLYVEVYRYSVKK